MDDVLSVQISDSEARLIGKNLRRQVEWIAIKCFRVFP